MNSCLLLMIFSAPLVVQDSSDQLFNKLDRDGNGLISSSEVKESQQAFFKRALRVADRNEDGLLSAEEFSVAVSDPKPVELPEVTLGRQAATFDIKRLDRNGDGNLTLEEIPPALKERFQELLSRVGSKSIPIDQAQAYLRGERPPGMPLKKADDKDTPAMKSKTPSDRPGQPGLKTNPAQKTRPGQGGGEAGNTAAAIFKNLDRNSDGKLSESELPDRMRENRKSIDTDNDDFVSRAEFQKAYERRMQNKKP